MIPNKKHQIFADEYVLTSDAIKAYQKAYPKAQPESARVKSYNLLQDVTIATYIKQKQDKIRIERENSQIEAVKQQDSINILQREKALEMTSNIAKLMYNQLAKNVR
jgi:phage terminase small subunit